MSIKFTNNAYTTLTATISAGATSFSIASAASFPTLGVGDWTYVSLTNEVVKVTAITGLTCTCVAVVGGHASGIAVELRMTAELLNDFAEDLDIYIHPTTAGNKHVPTGGTVDQLLTNTASGTGTWQNAPVSLPSQTTHTGKFLTTDGSAASWDSVDALPTQTGNNGKYLGTNGTVAAWVAHQDNSVEYTVVTAGQTSFAATYTAGTLNVYLNGIKLATTDYTATTGTTVVLDTGAAVNDTLFIRSFGTFDLANHYTNLAADARFEPIDATIVKDADIGVNVQAFDATIMVDADIGVTVQAYDADTAKTDVANTFTATQTFTGYTETQTTKSASFTPVFTEGTVYSCTGTMTITMPTATAGKSFTIIHATATSITWAGSIKWTRGAVPLADPGIDIYTFISDGSSWYGMQAATEMS